MIPSMLLGGLGVGRPASGGGPPAATNPSFANVKALLHFEGADASTTFTDVIGKTFTPAGNAQIDTAQFKFGSASGLFDGTGDYLSTSASSDFDLFGGDFMVEQFIRVSASNAADCIWHIESAANSYLSVFIDSLAIKMYSILAGAGGGFKITSSAVSTNAQHHIALTKTGSTFTLWVNGVSAGTSTTTTYPTGSMPLYIGRSGTASSAQDFAGWIDEFRVTKGQNVYTATFTPPIVAFPDS